MAVFQAAELLIPRKNLLENWAVIACDQFTSQPEYWREVRAQVGSRPSTYHITFPEAELGGDRAARIASINDHMRRYLEEDIFRSFPEACVYVERRLFDGSVRRGVVGVIDLEEYDYHRNAVSAVRATEQTVEERIPPRVRIRRDAVLETSHVMLLMDDASGRVLDSLEEKKQTLPLLYQHYKDSPLYAQYAPDAPAFGQEWDENHNLPAELAELVRRECVTRFA